MADTPEEVAASVADALFVNPMASETLIAAALREAEARGFAKGDAEWFEACAPNRDPARHDHEGWLWCGNCDLPLWLSTDPLDIGAPMCSCPWSKPLRDLQARAHRAAPKAPPEVAAAEPKP